MADKETKLDKIESEEAEKEVQEEVSEIQNQEGSDDANAETPEVSSTESKKKKKTETIIKISKGGKRPERKKPRHGKKHRDASKSIDQNKTYPLAEALELAKTASTSTFDGTLEIHIRTGIDTTKGDQVVRGTVTLPNSTAKAQKVAVIAEDAKHAEASTAGADLVGSEDLIAKIEGGFMEFDVLVATPAMMPKLGKLGKILGPKGLMPNPKLGTVTTDLKKAVGELKAGRTEFRADAQGIVHGAVGKVSQDSKATLANIKVYLDAVNKAKPDVVKNVYIASISLSPTMGPGVRVDLKSL